MTKKKSKTRLKSRKKILITGGTGFLGINFPEQYIKLFDFEFGFYWMKMTTGSGDMFGKNGTIWANMGIGKSFFDNRFKVSLKLNNLFDQGGFQLNETYNIYPSENTFPNGTD